MDPEKRIPLVSSLERWGPALLAVVLALCFVVLRVLSPGVLELADGDYHYQFARWAWAHPELLLDHWAKPLFTLLASPFARLGLWGITLFNALLALLAALLSISVVRRQATGAGWLVPILLFLAPAWLYVLLAGMTEALFAVLCIVVVWALVSERYTLAAIIASFMPFARPEYVAFLPAVAAWLAWRRQWRSLPWMLFGFALYSLVGWPVFHDPLWFIHNDPYPGNEIYGSGAFSHFWDERDEILGEPLRKLFMVACALMIVLFIRERDRREQHLRIVVLAAGPAFAMWLAHSYVWWKGGHGSMGLIRVLATSIPLLVLFTAHVLAACWRRVPAFRWRWVLGLAAILVLCNWGINDVRSRMKLPVQASGMQRLVERAADRVKAIRAPGQRLIYLFPHIGVHAGVDPWDTADARIIYFLDWDRGDWGLRDGDLLAWDAQLCPKDGGMPLEHLLNERNFILENVFVPDEQVEVFGQPFEIWLFRRGAATRVERIDTLYTLNRRSSGIDEVSIESAQCESAAAVCARTLRIGGVPIETDSAFVTELEATVEFAGALAKPEQVRLRYIADEGSGTGRRWEEGVQENRMRLLVHVPQDMSGSRHNIELVGGEGQVLPLRSFTVVRRSWVQRKGG